MKEKKKKKMAITHVVFFQFKPGTESELVQDVRMPLLFFFFFSLFFLEGGRPASADRCYAHDIGMPSSCCSEGKLHPSRNWRAIYFILSGRKGQFP